MSGFLRFIGIGARAAEAKYDVDIFKLKKKGCEKNGGKIIFSNNADTCEVIGSDGSKKYIYPQEIIFGEKEKQGGSKKRKTKTKRIRTKKIKRSKNKKSRKHKLKF